MEKCQKKRENINSKLKHTKTRAEKVIAFISRYCLVPEGELIGTPVVLAPFQIKFIREVYDNPAVTDTAILSMARKNAKTATIAMLVLAHLVGPEAKQNSRIISGAMSREQAAEVYNAASKMVMLSSELSKVVRIIPTPKKLIGLPMNVEYQAISADAKTAHGKSPVLAILDEVGQVTGPRSDFIDAITTAQGAYESPLLIYISTQAATDADMLSILIDDALANKHPKTVCHLYAADEDCDVMDEAQWYKANPALGLFRSYADQKKQAENASRMPSFENTFRNLHLNQRITTNSPFISRSAWQACNDAPYPLEECSEIYGGLDLSAKTDLTSLVLLGFHEPSRTWNSHTWSWTPAQTLHERAKRDRVPYDLWVKQGLLLTTPGATIDYEVIIDQMKGILPTSLICLGFDRWRIDIFRKDMDRAGVEFPMEEVGQGYKSFSPALDSLETMILNKTLRHGGHPVLTMAAANSVVTYDPAGNRKLDKAKATGRIDPFVALTMAAGIAATKHADANIDEWLADPLIF